MELERDGLAKPGKQMVHPSPLLRLPNEVMNQFHLTEMLVSNLR